MFTLHFGPKCLFDAASREDLVQLALGILPTLFSATNESFNPFVEVHNIHWQITNPLFRNKGIFQTLCRNAWNPSAYLKKNY